MATLEREFEEYKALHKYAILKARIVQYYIDLEAGKPQIPDFLRDGQTPEDLADRDLRRLMASPGGLNEFNRLYEIAYQELAGVVE